jgi:hypothetical protein
MKEYFEEKQARKEILVGCDDFEIDELIKIQSTEFDRKRKYDDAHIALIRKEYKDNGLSVSEIARKYSMNYTTVRYNVDDHFKATHNAKRDGKHTGVDVCDFMNRVEYKKQLIKSKKIKVAHLI